MKKIKLKLKRRSMIMSRSMEKRLITGLMEILRVKNDSELKNDESNGDQD